MKVEVWSDFVCPFCYIGKRHFEEALKQFEGKSNVEVVFKSFELDPNAKLHYDMDMHHLLAAKYGMSLEQAKAANENVGRQAAQVGLTYHFDTMKPTNTFNAHRLTHFAAQHGKMTEMAERLFKAYFTESRHIGEHETLKELAAEIGLDPEKVSEMLNGDAFSKEVRADEQEAGMLGIQGVPFFVINRKYAVSGAQPVDVFVNALQKASEEESSFTILNDSKNESNDPYCADGKCEVPNNK
ncbi:DsbA family oxidoreductase [Bacillus sp. FJAT-49736]|uniref:DsbA family oxidoreductase n=1 Tax=Bacillus sp. FJAT-49736 TaxID=2833582 RepID=UPI001BCA1416|nr:DsbA family oxidoreductase [Bacillus sp. FJAT-49736]MBS4174360.1 DsbA family oxidoreductase [Bacillus sp. FJAT-49736]